MNAPMVAPVQPKVNAKRFVAPRSEFDQGKYNYRHGLGLESCATNDMTDGWLSCEEAGERFGWMRTPAARGEDMYWQSMMAGASTVEVM